MRGPHPEARDRRAALAPEHACDQAGEAEAGPGGGVGGLARRGAESVQDDSRRPQRPVALPPVLARLEPRPFVGRAAPLEQLHAIWEEVSRDQGRVVALVGEPGIGKTRLAARVAAQAHADGGVVLYGRADEENVSPYQPFVEALRHYAAHHAALTDEV